MGFVATRGDGGGQWQQGPHRVGQVSGQQILKEVLEKLWKEVPSGVPATTALAVCGSVHTDTGRYLLARQVTASLTSHPSVASMFAPQKTEYEG